MILLVQVVDDDTRRDGNIPPWTGLLVEVWGVRRPPIWVADSPLWSGGLVQMAGSLEPRLDVLLKLAVLQRHARGITLGFGSLGPLASGEPHGMSQLRVTLLYKINLWDTGRSSHSCFRAFMWSMKTSRSTVNPTPSSLIYSPVSGLRKKVARYSRPSKYLAVLYGVCPRMVHCEDDKERTRMTA